MQTPGGLVVSAVTSKAGRCGIAFISGWIVFMMSSQTLGPFNPNVYLALPSGEVKDGLGVMLATLLYLWTIWLSNVA